MSKRLVLPVALATLALMPSLAAEPVAVRASPVSLNPGDPQKRVVGRLEYRGGLHLTSDDPRFGGLSSIRVLPDGERLVAVTDEGWWVSARLVQRDGRLEGVEDVEMGPLLGPDGRAPEGKDSRDAESLALLPDGGFVVGFEREHRLLRYPPGTGRPDGVPVAVTSPPGLEKAPFNGGIEALVVLRRGSPVRAHRVLDRRGRGGGVDGRPRPLEAPRAAVRGGAPAVRRRGAPLGATCSSSSAPTTRTGAS